MRRWIALLSCFVLILSALFPAYAANDIPTLSAHSAVLMDADTTDLLYACNEKERRPMASTTKIMTALVVIETLPLDRIVTVSPDAVGVEGSSVYLRAGEKVSVENLLYAVLLQSANDAAAALAIETAGSIAQFAVMMNDRAAELGLQDTAFTNPHGLDEEGHYTTAYDLALLTSSALRNETFAAMVSTHRRIISLHDGESSCVLINHNRLLRQYEGCIGVKTGYTKVSGRCLVSAARRDGLTLICVTLSAPDDWRDHTRLLDFGFAHYQRFLLAEEGTLRISFPIAGGETETVTATNICTLAVSLPRGEHSFRAAVTAKQFYYAPITAGQVLGTITYFENDTAVASSPLIAMETAARRESPTLWQRFLAWFGR